MRPIKKDISIIFICNCLCIFCTMLSSCDITRHIPDDKYLLTKNKIVTDDNRIDKDELVSYIKQKPNRRVAIFRFHLRAYNMCPDCEINRSKKWSGKAVGWFGRMLGKIGKAIGEEPVIYDEIQAQKTVHQFKLYLKSKGFYYAKVSDTVITKKKERKRKVKKKKAQVIYYIEAATPPYIIRETEYKIKDKQIETVIKNDVNNSLLKQGSFFDTGILQNERTRITNLLKQNGYYGFLKEYVHYNIDSTLGNYQVKTYIIIDQLKDKTDTAENYTNHIKYKINNVYIYPDFNPQKAMQIQDDYIGDLMEIKHKKIIGYIFRIDSIRNFKPQTIINSTHLFKDSIYKSSNIEQTYKQLSTLRAFKLINISFDEKINTNNSNKDIGLLDCHVQLTPATLQSYKVEFEGITSATNFGLASNIIYEHRNLFKGAEQFNLGFNFAKEWLKGDDITSDKNSFAAGVEAELLIPRFYIPLKFINFRRQYNPKTTISAMYNYDRRPEYKRIMANAGLGYLWKSSDYFTHIINPIDFYIINMLINEDFKEKIKNDLQLESYQDHVILSFKYGFVYNNQKVTKKSSFLYLKYNIEIAGNLFTAIKSLLKEPKNVNSSGGTFYPLINSSLLGNTPYFQYSKIDIDMRYYQHFKTNQLVYRFNGGLGYPYGNSDVMPFSRKYFSGGSSSIRGWSVRNLGPGSYDNDSVSYIFHSADMKLEANLEYRFKIFSLLEGALFLDAGNIWTVTDDERKDTLFDITKFYKQIAVAGGIGIRMDLSFFIFRLDFGAALRDPAVGAMSNPDNTDIINIRDIPESKFWGFMKNKNYAFHFGIGYPF